MKADGLNIKGHDGFRVYPGRMTTKLKEMYAEDEIYALIVVRILIK